MMNGSNSDGLVSDEEPSQNDPPQDDERDDDQEDRGEGDDQDVEGDDESDEQSFEPQLSIGQSSGVGDQEDGGDDSDHNPHNGVAFHRRLMEAGSLWRGHAGGKTQTCSRVVDFLVEASESAGKSLQLLQAQFRGVKSAQEEDGEENTSPAHTATLSQVCKQALRGLTESQEEVELAIDVCKALVADNNSLKSKIQHSSEQLARAESEKKHLETVRASHKTMLAKLSQEGERIAQELTSSQEMLAVVRALHSKAEHELSRVRARSKLCSEQAEAVQCRLTNEILRLQQQIDDSFEDFDDQLKAAHKQHRTELVACRDGLLARLRVREKEAKELKAHVAEGSKGKQALLDEQQRLQQQLGVLRRNLQDTEARCSAAESAASDARADCERTARERDALRQACVELQRAVDSAAKSPCSCLWFRRPNTQFHKLEE